MDVTDQPRRVLQPRHVDVQIHPVDALDLEHHMLGQDIATDRATVMMGSGHSGGQLGQPTAIGGSYTGPVFAGHGLTPTDRSPSTHRRPRHASSGWGEAPLELAFVVGPDGNWLNLWKPTIDSLDPLLGRTNPEPRLASASTAGSPSWACT